MEGLHEDGIFPIPGQQLLKFIDPKEQNKMQPLFIILYMKMVSVLTVHMATTQTKPVSEQVVL